ncbi:unnamed protein product [Linum trigynum]|uniref:F-box domain-containing protein n=1 Tax=Linum trigynum TaxID=586398 RepID=A0AAV2FTZ0_9ROSI
MNDFPQDLIANVLSFTGSCESCSLVVVSATFWISSLSNIVWDRVSPPDHLAILSRTANDDKGYDSNLASNEDLFLRLCQHPIIIDENARCLHCDGFEIEDFLDWETF